MTKTIRNISLGIIALLIVFAIACKRVADPCLQTTNLSVAIGVYKPADTGTTGVDSVLPKAMIGYLANGWLQYNGAQDKKFYLRLDPKNDTCKWFISPDSTSSGLDTITLVYSRQLSFLSQSCGYRYNYFIADVKWTFNRIDSIKIKNNIVDGTANVENIKIFY